MLRQWRQPQAFEVVKTLSPRLCLFGPEDRSDLFLCQVQFFFQPGLKFAAYLLNRPLAFCDDGSYLSRLLIREVKFAAEPISDSLGEFFRMRDCVDNHIPDHYNSHSRSDG